MNKNNYISPYDKNDIDIIIEKLKDEYVIEETCEKSDYDELEEIIENAINDFNDSIINDESIEDDEELDFQDLKDDMYQAIQDSVMENYSKTI